MFFVVVFVIALKMALLLEFLCAMFALHIHLLTSSFYHPHKQKSENTYTAVDVSNIYNMKLTCVVLYTAMSAFVVCEMQRQNMTGCLSFSLALLFFFHFKNPLNGFLWANDVHTRMYCLLCELKKNYNLT